MATFVCGICLACWSEPDTTYAQPNVESTVHVKTCTHCQDYMHPHGDPFRGEFSN